VWICNKNGAGDTESEIFKASLDEVLSQYVDINGQGSKEPMERRFMGSGCYKINDYGSREPY
jgi:hypothetical protein